MQTLKVMQFQGLAPSVFCGMYFADQGAQVTLVARAESAPVSIPINKNILNRNKKCITIDLKNKDHFQIILQLLRDTDVLIDPYRPGVLEKLKLGPKDLYAINKRIVLLRVSGYGQSGPAALRPGHDLNYISVSGIMELINKPKQYQFPSNFLADFVSASLGITGTLGALHLREKTGVGKVIDCSLAHGCTYLAQNIQTAGSNEQQSTSKVFEMNVKGKNYIYNTKNDRQIKEEQLLNLIKDEEYYRSKNGDIQISQVKAIEPLIGNKLVNPFSPIQLSNLIKSKGEDDHEVFSKLRAKL